jgi:hypothetical protein
MRTFIALVLAALSLPAAATVPTDTSSSGPYTCNGTTTAFTVGFRFLANADLVVTKTVVATGTVVPLTLTTDYTVAGAGAPTGGTVTLTAGSKCGSGYTLSVKRVVSFTQPTAFSTSGAFSPKSHENALDRLTMGLQQVERDRAAGDSVLASAFTMGTPNANLAQVTATGSTIPRTLAARAADVINAKDFGAVSDGVTDSTAAVQAAVTAAASGGRRVLVPSNTLYTLDSVTIPAGVVVEDWSSGGVAVWVGTASGKRLGYRYSPNTGADNPLGRLSLYSEVASGPATSQGFPLGHDLALMANGPADLRLQSRPLDVTSSTNVIAPGLATIVVTSTAAFAPPATTGTSIVVDPDGASEETIGPASWAIVDGTHLQATFALAHVQPFTVRQSGSVDLDTRRLGINRADVTGRPLAVLDRTNSPLLTLPNDTSGAFPLSAVRLRALLTGDNGAGSDLLLRNATTASTVRVLNAANTAATFQLAEAAGAADLKLGNATNTPLRLQASADAPRISGGGTSGGFIFYGSQGGTGTTGTIRFRDNGTDDREAFTVTTGVSGGITVRGGAGAISGRHLLPVSVDRGDTSQSLTAGTDAQTQRWATALTAARTVTLSTTGAVNGDTFRVVRTGLGAFTLDVGPGLKTIPASTAAWVDVSFNGTAWILTGYGAL